MPEGPLPTTATRLPGQRARRVRLHPSLREPALDDGKLDLLDRDGARVDGKSAGSLTRGGADPAGDLGEVVRHLQAHERLTPVPVVDQVIPFRDQVVDGAAGGVAERDAAVHAARALLGKLLIRKRFRELLPRLHALFGREVMAGFPIELKKPRGMPHQWYTSSVSITLSVSLDSSSAMRSSAFL